MIRVFLFLLVGLFSIHCVNAQDFIEKVTPLELASKKSQVFPDADLEVLDEHQEVYFDFSNVDLEFKVVQIVTKKIKIYKESGASQASFVVGFTRNNYIQEKVSLEFANIYELKGSQIQKKQVDSSWILNPTNTKDYKEVGIDFSKVKPGSIIEYSYVKITNYFDVLPVWEIQSHIPKLRSTFSSTIPEYYHYEFVNNGSVKISHKQENVISNFSQSRQFLDKTSVPSIKTTLQASQIPAYQNQPYINNAQNYLAYVKMDLIWVQYPYSNKQVILESKPKFLESLVKSKYFFGQIQQDKYFNKQINKAEYLALPVKQRAQKVLELVQSKVKWNKQYSVFSSQGAKTAFNKGTGSSADINFILISMLNYVDIPAMPVLISTTDNGVKTTWQSMYYNNTIAVVNIDQQYFFADASSAFSSLGLLPLEDLNGQGQAISSTGELMQFNMVPEFLSTAKESYQMELHADGSIRGALLASYQGYYSMWFNQLYQQIGTFGYSQRFTQDHYGMRLSEIDITNLNNASNNVRVVAKVFKDSGVLNFNNKLFVNPYDWFSEKINPFTATQRFGDISFEFPSSQVYNVSFTIPKGYKVSQTPKQIQLEDSQIQMQLTSNITVKQNSVEVQLVFVRQQAQIAKVQYDRVQGFFEKMQEELQQFIIFEPSK
ncbi:DUF3857 domain-containing protein [Myroides sp. LJL119]